MSSSPVLGTNVAPISFPGIASGIDYNSIISKLTSRQLSQNTIYNNQITGLTSANTELIKINSLFVSVQNSLTALSQPTLFNQVSAIESNPSVLNATSNPAVQATPGTYTILKTQLATASSVTSSTTYGHSELDTVGGSPATTVPLINSYAQITPSNGDPTKGSAYVTIDGVKINYDVNTTSLAGLLTAINSAVGAVDPGFSATLAPGTDDVVFKSTDKPISIGSPNDNGNILQVLKLDQAQLVNTANSGLISGVAGVGGVNQLLVFNSTNGPGNAATNANYITPVTAGTFTINGVSISVDPTKDALSDVLKRINSSGAGVNASFNPETGQISIQNISTGPQGIILGAPGDSSNFLSASGLTGAGATNSIGAQASVTVQNSAGQTSTVYSNSNTISTAIPGVNLNITLATTVASTLTVSADSSSLVSAINTFVSAYNAAINEINVATIAPTVIAPPAGSLNAQSQSVGGGVLYNNADVLSIKDQLTNIVAGQFGTTGYNALSTIGLTLDSSFTIIAPSTPGSNNSTGPVTTQTLGGTDGALQALDVSKLQAALAANPSQVQALFTSGSGAISALGSYLTGVTGQPTTLAGGLAGTIPSISLLQGFENANSDQITSLQQQVSLITDSANAYADQLRKSFNASEQLISKYQSLQSQLAGFFKNG